MTEKLQNKSSAQAFHINFDLCNWRNFTLFFFPELFKATYGILRAKVCAVLALPFLIKETMLLLSGIWKAVAVGTRSSCAEFNKRTSPTTLAMPLTAWEKPEPTLHSEVRVKDFSGHSHGLFFVLY